MRNAVLINAGDDIVVSMLVYVTYVFSHLRLVNAEYALSLALILIPLIQNYLIKGGLFTYNGLVRTYTASMHALALSWLLIVGFIAISLSNQLPLLIVMPFVALAMAIGLAVRRSSSLTTTPLLSASPVLMLAGYSPQMVAFLSLIPFITALLMLAKLRSAYGGHVGLSKLTPAVALLQFTLYLLFNAITSIIQVIIITVCLLALIIVGMPLAKVRGGYLVIALVVLALTSIILKATPLLCAVVIFAIRLLLIQ
ncbi:hypothetical protein [Caldivirga sp.]|jgi:hypothetical protein|uniref:hypothetical protein n=1 Tax=Caldivirga sp. TaxID=2080243 RepID=UPI003D0F6BE5